MPCPGHGWNAARDGDVEAVVGIAIERRGPPAPASEGRAIGARNTDIRGRHGGGDDRRSGLVHLGRDSNARRHRRAARLIGDE
jgi:hypothetical protein